MNRITGDLAATDLREVIRTIYLEQESGVLEVALDERTRRLFFLDGELYLPPLGGATDGSRHQSPTHHDEQLASVGTLVLGWKQGRFSFDPGRATVPPSAVGPLSTGRLLMDTAVAGRDTAALLRLLGGDDELLVATAERPRAARAVDLSAADRVLVKRLVSPTPLGDLLSGAPDDDREVLETLCRLMAVGRIGPSRPAPISSLIDEGVLQRFSDRVRQDLDSQPLTLDSEAHREFLADKLRHLGELDHYALLGVEHGSTADEVHDAFRALGRTVHPCHAAALGLRDRDEAMRLLFERAVEAYLVLTDPQRQADYLHEIDRPASGGDRKPSTEADRQQLRVAAAELYQKAHQLVANEEYHYALELLKRAVKDDPRADYYSLMARVQERNPKWLHHAADSYRTAIQIDPEELGPRLALGALFERMGDAERARAVYRSVLVRVPDEPASRAALRRLDATQGAPVVAKGRPGWLARLFGRRR